VRRGRVEERIRNAAGLDLSQSQTFMDGLATASARRGSRAHESRLFFRWDSSSTTSSATSPDVDALARRLADAATLPLSDRPAPFASGQWLLDPAVAAALLAALSPAFHAKRPPRRAGTGPVSIPVRIADDATGDAPYDGEGVATRRIVLFDSGEWTGRLEDLRSAKRSGRQPTGHGVRSSFRTPPRAAPRRVFFEATDPAPAAALLARVKRGLFASAVTAPVRVDLERDRYEVEFTGISVVGGRAQGEVGGATATGRVTELLRRIAGAADDRQFFALPFLAGSPTLLIERTSFE
jgi:PmbA protein